MRPFRLEDVALTNQRVARLREIEAAGGPPATQVIGWIVLCAIWSDEHLTNAWIPEAVGNFYATGSCPQLAGAALDVDALRPETRNGQDGWLVVRR